MRRSLFLVSLRLQFSACSSLGNGFSTGSPSIGSLINGEQAMKLNLQHNIKFLDASWHLGKPNEGFIQFSTNRIPGAKFFDIDKIADLQTDLPHMLPTPEFFAESVENLGISNSDHVIIYTTSPGCFSASRAWWMFRIFGHAKVSILNGGLESWKKCGGSVQTGQDDSCFEKGSFIPSFNKKMVVNWEEVLSVVESGSSQILDARSKARFYAQAPEPRAGVEGGHIPGSLSLPFTSIVEEDLTTFKSKEEIRDAFVESGLIFGSRSILSCGTGVSAAVLCFGLDLIGKDIENAPIYDGSWTEWGTRSDLPKMK